MHHGAPHERPARRAGPQVWPGVWRFRTPHPPRLLPGDMLSLRNHRWTECQSAHSPAQRLGMSPGPPPGTCSVCGTTAGHGANMPTPRRENWTCPPCPPALPAQRLDMSSGSPNLGPRMPTLRGQGRTWCQDAHSAAQKMGMSPRGRGEDSAFMLFSIDKATDSKIKSINSTTCDGYHGSGRKARCTDARESQCSPKNANS